MAFSGEVFLNDGILGQQKPRVRIKVAMQILADWAGRFQQSQRTK